MDYHYKILRQCIELARKSVSEGELPFAAIIAHDEEIISQAHNRFMAETDITRDAVLIALSETQQKLQTNNLSRCTLYALVEPSVMCSFPLRETRIKRIVYGMRSPIMGGLTRWNILGDEILSRTLPEDFGPPPEMIQIMTSEAEAVWEERNPEKWQRLKKSTFF